MQLLEQHENNVMKAKAINSLLEGESLRKAATELGYNMHTFQNYRRRANKQLAGIYGCAS